MKSSALMGNKDDVKKRNKIFCRECNVLQLDNSTKI